MNSRRPTRTTYRTGVNPAVKSRARRWLILILVVAAGYEIWTRRQAIVSDSLSKSQTLRAVTGALPKAEHAASAAKARVNETEAIEAATAGDQVNDGMTREKVRSLLGDPARITHNANGDEVWHYPVVAKEIVFRYKQVWDIEPDTTN